MTERRKELGKEATQSVCVVIVDYDFVNGRDYAREREAVKSYFSGKWISHAPRWDNFKWF
jgi:hypothetical protein